MRTPPADLARRLSEVADRFVGRGAALRIEEVAAASGVPRATLYYYFSGRGELLAFLLERELDALGDRLEEVAGGPGDVPERLAAVLLRLVEETGPRPEVCLGLLTVLAEDPARRAHLEGAAGTPLHPLRALVEEGMREGLLRSGDPGLAVAGALGTALVGAAARGAGTAGEALVGQVLDGLRTPRTSA